MHRCPHCGERTISNLAKWWSSSTAPTQCSACGNPSFVPASESNATFVLSAALLAGAIVAGLSSRSPALLAALSALVVVFYAWRWHRSTLVPTTMAEASASRTVAFILLGGIATYAVYRFVFGGGA